MNRCHDSTVINFKNETCELFSARFRCHGPDFNWCFSQIKLLGMLQFGKLLLRPLQRLLLGCAITAQLSFVEHVCAHVNVCAHMNASRHNESFVHHIYQLRA